MSNCNLQLNFSTFTTIHSPKRNKAKGVFASGMFKEVSNFNGSNYSDMDWFFSSGSEFSLFFFIFYSRVWFICYNYVHFFIVINTNSQHFQVLYFVWISAAEGPLILASVNQSLFQMSLLDELLSSLLHVGQLYAQQGAVRESFRQFVHGLTLARHFALPYRYSLQCFSLTSLVLDCLIQYTVVSHNYLALFCSLSAAL